MSWGREFVWPDPDFVTDEYEGWVPWEAIPDEDEARTFAAAELGAQPDELRLTRVLMREETEVEAKISGHEAPNWVYCTPRARRPVPFWHVEGKPLP